MFPYQIAKRPTLKCGTDKRDFLRSPQIIPKIIIAYNFCQTVNINDEYARFLNLTCGKNSHIAFNLISI